MQVWFRLMRVGWWALRRSGSVGAGYRSSLAFRVSPGDIDVNRHMNNGRYLTIMDLGRIDVLIRTGLWREMNRQKLQGSSSPLSACVTATRSTHGIASASTAIFSAGATTA